MAYFGYQKDRLPASEISKIQKVLDVHAKLFNIKDIKLTKKAADSSESIQADTPKPRYLLPERNFCKVASADDVNKAEFLFDTGFLSLQLSDRVEFANNFVKAANEFNTTFKSENIEKYAGVLDYDYAHTQYVLELRAGAVKRMGGDTTMFRKLAEELSELTESPTHEELEGLVKVIETMDKTAGIKEKQYDKSIHSPQAAVFHKNATESSETTEGKDLHMSKADIIGEFGEDILESVELEDGTIDYTELERLKNLKNGLTGSANAK
jgi:hypothetical protein